MVVETPLLRVNCDVRGPDAGPPVLLLHGWPYDARCWEEVAAALSTRGHRVIVPSLRGFGETRFRDSETARTGGATALAADATALLDALNIGRAIVVGHDWGGRAGYAMAALWPERVARLVALSVEYETGVTPGFRLNYVQQRALWYQWFFASERGREALADNRRGLCRDLWAMWSPTWAFGEATFGRAAAAWDNPDWVDITLHSYRSRWGNAPADPRYANLDAELNSRPMIAVPTSGARAIQDRIAVAISRLDQAPSPE